MKCNFDNFESENKKSFANHLRFHKGMTSKGQPNFKNRAELNGMWKGDKVGIIPLHQWIRSYKHKPALCEDCKINSPYDLANISQKYYRDIDDFKWICRSCHMKEDGRIKRMHEIAHKLVRKRDNHGRYLAI